MRDIKQIIKEEINDFGWADEVPTPESPKQLVMDGLAIQFNTIKDLKRVYRWFKKEGFKLDMPMSGYIKEFKEKRNFNIFFYHPSFNALDLATEQWFASYGPKYRIMNVKDIHFID